MKTYQDLETENKVLREQIAIKEERILALVGTVERLINLTNRTLLKFQKPATK
jgi:hypothetical protein